MSPQPFTLSAAIGNTPLVKITKLNPNPAVQIFAKLEGSNPGGSVKDRPAWYMIKKAIEDGSLTPDKTILEPTSGNTGIALAMIGASLGYHVKLVMPPCVSVERRSVLEAYGAEVVLSTQGQATDGAILLAHQIVKESPDQYFMPNQYSNPNNPLAHYETTGPEIYRQCNGNIDTFIAGIGTSGTLMGTGRALKERDPSIRIIGVEPTLGHSVQGLKNMQEAIVPDIYHEENLDDKLVVEDDEAFNCARDLAIHEGLFVGMSSGAAVAGALRVAATMKSGTIVTLLPDRGDRYLSTSLFRSTCACCPP
ncbi:PLP-dependent cysteine synthase family protein [Desulfuromonas acetoxidans]|uniref:cysteine synthase n=1 Tax=Desulfuromonas acetoxidans (strain DSM 684 / 11070) TaxID=281689 RepID=Q1JZJ0_DESA6|nr:cysteine synthase family protein [Desulfuromonas acetoxidans]EAT15577.1 cysteine synthases [Desulfuromonas acetoxidans DSM 684]MBF0646093.1 cysteine synthase family protein [Desulfuromonas acetoxidans]NVD25169.1 cysteine synthase family protein [Desulfuromonas acetoxidans]NVE17209.1 cysteine synthase family protein [Desulfuromonas acetoxidans]